MVGNRRHLHVFDLQTGQEAAAIDVFPEDGCSKADYLRFVVALDRWGGETYAVVSEFDVPPERCGEAGVEYSIIRVTDEGLIFNEVPRFVEKANFLHTSIVDFGNALQVDGEVAFVGLDDLHAVDLQAKEVRWSSLIYQGGFVGGDWGVVAAFNGQLSRLDRDTGIALWSTHTVFGTQTPVVRDGYIYAEVGPGNIGKLDVSTGFVVWEAAFNYYINMTTSPGFSVWQDWVFFPHTGILFALHEGGPTGALPCDGQWETSYKGDPWSYPW